MQEKDSRYIYQLSSDLIANALTKAKGKYDDLLLAALKTSDILSPQASQQFISAKMDQLKDWMKYLNQIVSSFNTAWQANDEMELRNTMKRLEQAFEALYDWEVSLRSVIPSENWGEAFEKFKGCTLSILNDIERMNNALRNFVQNPNASGRKYLDLTVHFPERLKNIDKLMARAHERSLRTQDQDNNSDPGFWLELIKMFWK